MLVGSGVCVAVVATGQQIPTGGQEGVQQPSYQNMSASERAARTRAFLGLGAVPDKAAAARGDPLYVENCSVCHGQTARGAMGPGLVTSDIVLADDHGEHLTPFLKKGTPEKGMPAFATMADRQLTDIAEFLQREEIGGMLGAVELVRRRLVDRYGDGACRRVGAPTGVDGEGFRFVSLSGHAGSLPGSGSLISLK